MSRELEEIKARTDIVELLKSYLTLTPAGRSWKAICPFHGEKTPSFFISPERQIWHCFGACGDGGDALKFVMKYENVEFREALQILAERAGIKLHTINPSLDREYGILHDIHEETKRFYQKELTKNENALEYIKSRGIKPETAEQFEIGFAPGGGETLTLYLLKEKGININDIIRSGLSQRNVRGLFRDKFQDRIMFPITNHIGKTIAFTGRLMPYVSLDLPKYLNSPETPIFNKSKVLYGFHLSKNAIAESKTAFLVEGQMDVVMSWQAGIRNVTAVSGTSLTIDHLTRLRRIADSLIVSFDNDHAGIEALERSLDLLGSMDFYVKAINLGEFKDPAEAVEKNPDFLVKAIEGARPVLNHLFEHYLGSGVPSIIEKKRIIRKLLGKVKLVRSEIEQDLWIHELGRYSGISPHALKLELVMIPDPRVKEKELQKDSSPESLEKAKDTDRSRVIADRFVSLGFTNPEFLAIVKANKEYLPEGYEKVLSGEEKGTSSLYEMRGEFEKVQRKEEIRIGELEELATRLKVEWLKKKKGTIRDEMRKAELAGKETEAKNILQQFQKVTEEMAELEDSLTHKK